MVLVASFVWNNDTMEESITFVEEWVLVGVIPAKRSVSEGVGLRWKDCLLQLLPLHTSVVHVFCGENILWAGDMGALHTADVSFKG